MEEIILLKSRIYETDEYYYSNYKDNWYIDCQVLKDGGSLNLREYYAKEYHAPNMGTTNPKGQIAISRDSVLCLNDSGKTTQLIEKQNNCFSSVQRKIIALASTGEDYIGLTEDGELVIENPTRFHGISCSSDYGRRIIDVVACEGHLALLQIDGDVKCYDLAGWLSSPDHKTIVNSWHNIKQVAMGYYNAMGLKSDGTVLYHSELETTDRHFYNHCRGVVQVDCTSVYYGVDYSAVLHADGTVTSDSFEGTKEWHDIIQIAVNERCVVGLKRNGTVVAIKNGKDVSDQIDWTDIVNIECKFFLLVGITKGGYVKAMMLSI